MTALRLLMAVLMLGGSLSLAACESDNEGVAENAGESIDEGVNDAGRAIDDATD